MAEGSRPAGAKPRVMVVDDELEALEAVQAVLGREYELLPLSEGEGLAEEAEAFQPDLLILDVRLKDAQGFELCRQLKARRATRGIPVIFLTGLGADKDFLAGFDSGGLVYLTKPVTPAELRRAVHSVLASQTLV